MLFSVKASFADAILDGSKKYELRKVSPKTIPPMKMLIYATSPRMMVLGYCTVTRVLRKPIGHLWLIVQGSAGLTKKAFFGYFRGSECGSALSILEPKKMETPVSLSEIRRYSKNYSPPRSMEYVSDEHPVALALDEVGYWPLG